jgi:hypothetical protein
MKDLFEALILLILSCLLIVMWIVMYLLIMVGIVALPAIAVMWIIEAL